MSAEGTSVILRARISLMRCSGRRSVRDTSDVIQEKNQIILIGIELPGTNGKYRAANDLILKNGFIIDSQTKYENGLVSIKFIRDE